MVGLTGPMEVWLKTVRGQDKRGVPLVRRRTDNPEALEQTRVLQHYRTQSHFSQAESPTLPGANQCQQCGKRLPKRRGLKLWKVKKVVYLRSGPVKFYICPKCQ